MSKQQSTTAVDTRKASSGAAKVVRHTLSVYSSREDEAFRVGDCAYVVMDPERYDEAAEGNEPCEVCGQIELAYSRDEQVPMLECSTCLRGYHLSCLVPPLQDVPEVNNFCCCCFLLNQGWPVFSATSDNHSMGSAGPSIDLLRYWQASFKAGSKCAAAQQAPVISHTLDVVLLAQTCILTDICVHACREIGPVPDVRQGRSRSHAVAPLQRESMFRCGAQRPPAHCALTHLSM